MAYPKELSVRDYQSRTKRRSRLATHRRKTHNKVKERERGRCGICKWNAGSDMHHVYGRGVSSTDWNESAEACMWVCRTCHPYGYVHNRGDNPELENILKECVEGIRFTWEPPIDGC